LNHTFQAAEEGWVRNAGRLGIQDFRLSPGAKGSYRKCHRDAVIAA
jgi:hypothetical protein